MSVYQRYLRICDKHRNLLCWHIYSDIAWADPEGGGGGGGLGYKWLKASIDILVRSPLEEVRMALCEIL